MSNKHQSNSSNLPNPLIQIIESLECIKGKGPSDLENITCVQGAVLLCGAGIAKTQEEGEDMIRNTFKDGSALDMFLKILENQGIVDVCLSKSTEKSNEIQTDKQIFKNTSFFWKPSKKIFNHIKSQSNIRISLNS